MTPKAAKATLRQDRASIHDVLSGMARQLEQIVSRAQTPGTAEHAELSVRRSMRVAQDIVRKALALRAVRDPTPWITAPTRQREAKDQGPAQREIVEAGGAAVGVRHRWDWPVKAMQQRGLLSVHQVVACARLRAAFDAMHFPAATPSYGESREPRSGFITPRNEQRQIRQAALNADRGTTDRARLAGEEFGFVSARLEEELKAIAWVLILEQKLPGEEAPLSAVQFGKRLGGMRSDDHARWYALGALKVTAARLASIYRHWDVAERERQRRIAQAKVAT